MQLAVLDRRAIHHSDESLQVGWLIYFGPLWFLIPVSRLMLNRTECAYCTVETMRRFSIICSKKIAPDFEIRKIVTGERKRMYENDRPNAVFRILDRTLSYTHSELLLARNKRNCWFCCFVFQCVSASYSEATRVCHNQVPSTLFTCNVPPFRRFVKTMTGCLGEDLGVTYRTIFIFEYLLLGAAWQFQAAPKYSFFQGPGPTAT